MLGLREEQGSECKCSQHPQDWNIINKNLFLSILIVGSYTKVPCEQDPVCLVTVRSPNLKNHDDCDKFL